MAFKIFGKYLIYKDIRIHSEIPEDFQRQHGGAFAMAPNNNVYFDEFHYCDDFSKADFSSRKYFIHELAYVLDFQRGVDLVSEHFKNKKSFNNIGDAYGYSRKDFHRGLGYLNIEQRARFVDNLYHMLRISKGEDSALFNNKDLQIPDMKFDQAWNFWNNFLEAPKFRSSYDIYDR